MTGRSTTRCDCGAPCFYRDRALSQHRHEHDHFPIPWRHGGEATVPARRECHSLKDRCRPLGIRPGGDPDDPILDAIETGMRSLPGIYVGSLDEGDRVPGIVLWLYGGIADSGDLPCWDDGYELVEGVEEASEVVADQVTRCTTPEARIGLAQMFAVWLDRLDSTLQSKGES